jgi:predicted GNAT family N-acyltransferase
MILGTRKLGPASLRLCRPSALPDTMQMDVVELVGLATEASERRKGHATSLMLQTCCEADIARKFMMLCVDADDKQKLMEFYNGFGFVPIQAEPLIMVRPYVGARNVH